MAIRFRWPILILSALPLLGAYAAVTLDSEESYDLWFLDSDPALQAYRDFHELFGNDEFLLLSMEAPDGTVFSNATLESVERITSFLEDRQEIGRVLSLTRHEVVRGEDDDLVVDRPLANLPVSEADLARARESILGDRMALGSVVASEGRVATIVAEIRYRSQKSRHRNGLLETVQAKLDQEKQEHGLDYGLMAGASLDAEIHRQSRGDIFREVPIVLLVIALVLWLTTRSVAGTVLPLAVVGTAVIIARLTMVLLGWKDNSILIIMPLVVLAVGVADSVHIVVHYLRRRGDGEGPEDAARETVRRMFRPCFLTTLTTAVGFLALLTTSLAPLRQLGVMSALGVSAALLYSIFPLPAALSLLRGDLAPRGHHQSGLFARLTAALPGFTLRHRRAIFAWATVTTVAAGFGMARLQVEANAIELFREDDPIRILGERIEQQSGGIGSLEVVVTANRTGGIRDPELLTAMDDLRRFLETQPLVSGSSSVVDLIKGLNRAMHGDDPAYEAVPATAAEVAQYLLLYESSSEVGLGTLLDITATHARVWSRTRFGSSTEYKDLQEAVAGFVEERFPDTAEVQTTGILTLYKNMGDYLIQSQIRSFAFALLFITLIMTITFRSVRIGFLSLIPNVWPIAVTVGFMGWSGIWLNPATAMVAAVTIGIAVDDSVHFLTKYREARNMGRDHDAAIRHAFDISGKAIVFTTVILLAGFMVITTSEFKPYVEFAILCCMAIFLALVGDLLVLPAVLHGLAGKSSRARGSSAAVISGCVGLALLAAPALTPQAMAGDTAGRNVLAQNTTEPTRSEGDSAMLDPKARGRQVMERIETADRAVTSEQVDAIMTLRDKGGREVQREAMLAFLELEDGSSRSLIRFESPPDIQGTAFLTHRDGDDEDRWLYLPAVKRVKRIAGSRKSGRFAGTELSYEDLGGRNLDDYDYEYLGQNIHEGEAVDIVVSIPRDKDSGYERIETWVSRDRPVVLRADYFADGERLKTSVASRFEQVDDVHWRSGRVEVTNTRSGRVTILEIRSRDLDADLEPTDFTIESLRGEW